MTVREMIQKRIMARSKAESDNTRDDSDSDESIQFDNSAVVLSGLRQAAAPAAGSAFSAPADSADRVSVRSHRSAGSRRSRRSVTDDLEPLSKLREQMKRERERDFHVATPSVAATAAAAAAAAAVESPHSGVITHALADPCSAPSLATRVSAGTTQGAPPLELSPAALKMHHEGLRESADELLARQPEKRARAL
jgi:hypothetical protein